MSAIIERIEHAVAEFRKQTMDEPKVLRLGISEAREFYRWSMDNVMVRWDVPVATAEHVPAQTPEEFLQRWEYRGMRIHLSSEPEGITIAP